VAKASGALTGEPSRVSGRACPLTRLAGNIGAAIARVINEQVLGCKTVGFDEHALTRMDERGVSEDEVVEVLREPDKTGLPTQPNRFRYRKDLGGRDVDVVFEHDPTQIVVITVVA
jgi:hypothetical protein